MDEEYIESRQSFPEFSITTITHGCDGPTLDTRLIYYPLRASTTWQRSPSKAARTS